MEGDRIEISDAELSSFTTAVSARFGIDFSGYEKKSLKRGLVRLMVRGGEISILGLWSQMLLNKELLFSYIDELMVNLTEFFRNAELWQKLYHDIYPRLIDKEKIDIWHAGCSTGEEIYSNVIVLKEKFMLNKANFLATDLSSKALAKAIEGSYHNLLWEKYLKSYNAYRGEGDAEKYFYKGPQEFELNAVLKKNIRFQRHNLVQDEVREKFDLVFCRNVMIYFDDPLKMKVVKKIHESLKEDGFFIIGYYDMMPEEIKKYFKLYCATTRIYTKR